MNRVTAQDVAKAAGVSVATVDRVLNARKGVSESTIEKVHSAMDQLHFVRNQAAADLARGKSYRFTFILPAGETTFFRDLLSEVEAAKTEASKNRIDIRAVTVPPLNPEAVVHAIDALGDDVGDGLALVAIESQIVRDAINKLRNQGVRIVTFISDIPNSRRDRFIGIDNVAAGRVAASLLKRFISAPSGDVAVIAGSGILRDHVERRMGFEQVMRAECPHLNVLPWIEGEEMAGVVEEKLSKLLASNPNIVGLYSLGGGTRGVIEAIESAKTNIRAVTTELSEHTRDALISGTVDAVLVQDPGHEVRSAVRVLKALTDNGPINENQERIRIEIFMRDNLP
ncbi:LacI family DNA-binding transcriptional regulator [Roseobacter denitrificans]|uniref:Transcriptional regulator protein, putative n=1 Tax=Roseobacter denitrificans (strain ATCC 33942 / OCh 114) TaxID=375451 RepID=Q161J6_ROSDO|nr:LacI family DNA-binding transcriptional regulator [Roseobacter denitrificans]ABG33347.1 transcriptional regulator protein, putative [Roseobacter denitrificans OCh 114]AVL52676.1 LacI family DNA-binding transcriptional regulator [Roseobacter denitrificans]SFG23199.1 transcriptional regulator, LacI family [Roseobacter denitrificans OCh 114]